MYCWVAICLILAQMGLWYQARPLHLGESAVVVMNLNGEVDAPLPKVVLESAPGAEVTLGPVQVLSKRQIYWKIEASDNGRHVLVFQVDQERVEKQLAIGQAFMPVSVERPGWGWASINIRWQVTKSCWIFPIINHLCVRVAHKHFFAFKCYCCHTLEVQTVTENMESCIIAIFPNRKFWIIRSIVGLS